MAGAIKLAAHYAQEAGAQSETGRAGSRTLARLDRPEQLLIIVHGCVVNANSLRNPFVFDDQRTIFDNSTIRDISLNTVLHPQRQTPVAGRPLANLSFALNYAAGGRNPAGYHAWNLAMIMILDGGSHFFRSCGA